MMPHLVKHHNPDHRRGVVYDATPSEAPQPRPWEGGMMLHLVKHQNPDHGRGVRYDAASCEAPQPRPSEGGSV